MKSGVRRKSKWFLTGNFSSLVFDINFLAMVIDDFVSILGICVNACGLRTDWSRLIIDTSFIPVLISPSMILSHCSLLSILVKFHDQCLTPWLQFHWCSYYDLLLVPLIKSPSMFQLPPCLLPPCLLSSFYQLFCLVKLISFISIKYIDYLNVYAICVCCCHCSNSIDHIRMHLHILLMALLNYIDAILNAHTYRVNLLLFHVLSIQSLRSNG